MYIASHFVQLWEVFLQYFFNTFLTIIVSDVWFSEFLDLCLIFLSFLLLAGPVLILLSRSCPFHLTFVVNLPV
jgi:hypothetical protein